MNKLNKTTYLIGAASIALIALFVLQVEWMVNSHDLIEEQFDQKVRLALCSTVESLNDGKVECSPENVVCQPGYSGKSTFGDLVNASTGPNSCLPVESNANQFKLETPKAFKRSDIDSTLSRMLAFYDITLDYELNVLNETCAQNITDASYCCALSPFETASGDQLMISFPGKEKYILGQLKFMLFSSIVILFFITAVFAYAIYTLKRQKQIDKINRNFFNSMAHEFRTPLTNIGLATRLLKKQKATPKESQYLGIVDKESKRLKHQVERILHLTKLENGDYQLEKEQVNVLELLHETIADMRLRIQEKGAHVRLDVETEDLTVLGDKFHLGNAFRNLLDNALKYTPEDAEIDITVQKGKNGILILFQDNGIGIPKKDQPLVFKEYKRSKIFASQQQNGFGLGLSYVKMIVERHNGFIKVISELNKGCRFDLFLPAK